MSLIENTKISGSFGAKSNVLSAGVCTWGGPNSEPSYRLVQETQAGQVDQDFRDAARILLMIDWILSGCGKPLTSISMSACPVVETVTRPTPKIR